jgi:hypothetical protein
MRFVVTGFDILLFIFLVSCLMFGAPKVKICIGAQCPDATTQAVQDQ